MLEKPYYNPLLSYEDNYQLGPFGELIHQEEIPRHSSPRFNFLGHQIHLPFGIPAGPLVNSRFISAAFNQGFDLCVYKTVRTKEYPCHPWPNVLAVHEKQLSFNRTEPVIADSLFKEPLSITNSFGVPSAELKIWQADMAKAVESAHPGQLLIGSFQGTPDGSGQFTNYQNDFAKAAYLVKETGAQILEANLSCPNEGTSNLLCFDLEKTYLIAQAIRKEIGDTPLILKLAYFQDESLLESFIKRLSPLVDGFAAINTIIAQVNNQNGQQALPGEGRARSGICGAAINWAGLEMTQRIANIRQKNKYDFTIIGVGGVSNIEDYTNYISAGADAVMSATGSMWNSHLAKEIYDALNTYST